MPKRCVVSIGIASLDYQVPAAREKELTLSHALHTSGFQAILYRQNSHGLQSTECAQCNRPGRIDPSGNPGSSTAPTADCSWMLSISHFCCFIWMLVLHISAWFQLREEFIKESLQGAIPVIIPCT